MKQTLLYIISILTLTMASIDVYSQPSPRATKQNLTTEKIGARAAQILGDVSRKFQALKRYSVEFEVTLPDGKTSGEYAVDGEAYQLTVGIAEVYSDGKVRYEVDKQHGEVVVTENDTKSLHLLDNPVRAFDFLTQDYSASLLREEGIRAFIGVKYQGKTSEEEALEEMTLEVDVEALQPLAVEYNYEGDKVQIRVKKMTLLTTPLPHFKKEEYSDFEWIDFR